MRFKPQRRVPFVATDRKRELYRRKVLDGLGYSQRLMPEHQPDVDAEFARRAAARDQAQADWRDRRARDWREFRARFYALTPEERAIGREKMRAWNGPLEPGYLAHAIWGRKK